MVRMKEINGVRKKNPRVEVFKKEIASYSKIKGTGKPQRKKKTTRS